MGIKTWTTEVLTASDVNTYLMKQAVITCTAGTRPSSPVNGMRIWQTDTLTEHVYDGVGWVFLRGIGLYASKTADETVNNSNTTQNDDHLFFSVAANSTYLVHLFLIVNSPTTADFSDFGAFSMPSGATTAFSFDAPERGETALDASNVNLHRYALDGTDYVNGIAGYGADMTVFVKDFLLITAGTSGTVTYRWAQFSAVASNTTVKSGSYLFAEKIA